MRMLFPAAGWSLSVVPNVSLVSVAFVVFASLVGCGGAGGQPATPTSVEAPKAEEKRAPVEDPRAKQNAAIEKLTKGEADSGSCSAAHKAALDQILTQMEEGMRAKAGDDGKSLGISTVDKRTVPLSDKRNAITMAVSGRGTEVHVIAVGLREISLDVIAGTTAASTMRSPFQRSATTAPLTLSLPDVGTVTELESDSRQVQIKPGQQLEVRLRGQGCTALAVFQKP